MKEPLSVRDYEEERIIRLNKNEEEYETLDGRVSGS